MSEERDVIRCSSCNLVQFLTKSGLCRRCHAVFEPAYQMPKEALLGTEARVSTVKEIEGLPKRVIAIRRRSGMTQGQLEDKTGICRSYLSRLESGQMVPSIGMLERLAEGLDVQVRDFFLPEVVLDDPFVREMAPLLKKLSGPQHRRLFEAVKAASIQY